MSTKVQTKVQANTTQTFTPVLHKPRSLSDSHHLILQRRDHHEPNMQEPGKPVHGTPAFIDPSFGHDFNRVRIFNEGAGRNLPIQAKLRINKAGDVYEQEADRVAEQVSNAHNRMDICPITVLSRNINPEENKLIVRKPEDESRYPSEEPGSYGEKEAPVWAVPLKYRLNYDSNFKLFWDSATFRSWSKSIIDSYARDAESDREFYRKFITGLETKLKWLEGLGPLELSTISGEQMVHEAFQEVMQKCIVAGIGIGGYTQLDPYSESFCNITVLRTDNPFLIFPYWQHERVHQKLCLTLTGGRKGLVEKVKAANAFSNADLIIKSEIEAYKKTIEVIDQELKTFQDESYAKESVKAPLCTGETFSIHKKPSTIGATSGAQNLPGLEKEDSGSTPEVTPELESSIIGIRGGGQPLPESVRAFYEPRFGHDFSQVRVHTDAQAAETARVLNARAFTLGENVVFGAGQYVPGVSEGRRLMAHELTHVVQQSGSNGSRISQSNEKCGPPHISHIVGTTTQEIARQPDIGSYTSGLGSSGNFTPAQAELLKQARVILKPIKKSIVGVLITEDGRQFLFKSGGGQGFYSHIEGKTTLKMNELGIKKATLILEKECCQICDRSVYPKGGPEIPLRSSATGREISRQTPKICSTLPIDSELKVVGPYSTGLYRGIKTTISTPKIGTVPGEQGPKIPSAVGKATPAFKGGAIPTTTPGAAEPNAKPVAPTLKSKLTISLPKRVKPFIGRAVRGIAANLALVGLVWLLDSALSPWLREPERLRALRDWNNLLPQIRDKLLEREISSKAKTLEETCPLDFIFANIRVQVVFGVYHADGEKQYYKNTDLIGVDVSTEDKDDITYQENGARILRIEFSEEYANLTAGLATANLKTVGFLGDTEIRDWVQKNKLTAIRAVPTPEKIRLIDRLLSGWVSDDDVVAIQYICKSVSYEEEASEITKQIEPLTSGIGHGERYKVRSALMDMRKRSRT